MKFISKSAAEKILKENQNKIISVEFMKANGEIRTLTGRLNVKVGVIGIGKRYEDAPLELFTIFEMSKQQFRTLSLNRIISIKHQGQFIKGGSK